MGASVDANAPEGRAKRRKAGGVFGGILKPLAASVSQKVDDPFSPTTPMLIASSQPKAQVQMNAPAESFAEPAPSASAGTTVPEALGTDLAQGSAQAQRLRRNLDPYTAWPVQRDMSRTVSRGAEMFPALTRRNNGGFG